MPTEESITDWIRDLKVGDDHATDMLWQRYFGRLVATSRRVLRGTSRAASDEEDVALSAFNSFFRCVAEDRFPRLDDRDDLWKILLTIAIRKALRVVRREKRRALTASEFLQEQVAGNEPSPALTALVNDEFRQLFSGLRTEDLRQIALLKLEGNTNKEIAQRLGRSESFVERKLRLIRQIWSHKAPPA